MMEMTTTQDDTWQQARPRRRPRAVSPAPSTSSSATNTSRRSRGSTAASTASTRWRGARGTGIKGTGIQDISTLLTKVGRAYIGTVTGVRDFGAFVDIGVGKDGLVHVRETDAQGTHVAEHTHVGKTLTVFVKAVDYTAGKYTLSVRDPTARQQPGPSAAAVAAMAAVAERKREVERERMARQEAAWREEERELTVAREREEARLRRLREVEAEMVAAAEQRG